MSLIEESSFNGIFAILRENVPCRNGMPITWVDDELGGVMPLSRYGDDVLDFSPYIPNHAAMSRTIDVSAIPARWRTSFLDVILNFWISGRPGSISPKASTLVRAASQLAIFIRWLDDHKIKCFSEVRPIHYSHFAQYLHETPIANISRRGKFRTPKGVGNVLWAVTLPWHLRLRLADHVLMAPFPDGAGITKASKTAKHGIQEASTYCMTLEEYSALYRTCDQHLANTDECINMLESREMGRHLYPDKSDEQLDTEFERNLLAMRGETVTQFNERISDIRSAAATQLCLLVGLRISELLSLERGCFFEREIGDEKAGWIKGLTFKPSQEHTKGKVTEWLAPFRVSVLISILTRLSDVDRTILVGEMESIRDRIGKCGSEAAKSKLYAKLAKAKRCLKSVFLTRCRAKGKASCEFVRVPSHRTATRWMRSMASDAGLSCPISCHVLRRSFAYTVVRHLNGDIRYLREHFQHWSIETTQLYVTLSTRDDELADEIGHAILDFKTDLVSSWLDQDKILAGLGGQHITKTRDRPEFQATLSSDLRSLSSSLSEGLLIRPTGHGWCMSRGAQPCGGRGLYDPVECIECGGAVVTEDEIPVWSGLVEQFLIAEERGDCGPSGAQKVQSDLGMFDRILKPFGLSVSQARRRRKEEGPNAER